jgi:lysozyme family protein
MKENFHRSLALTLKAETSYEQPLDGPFVRFKSTAKRKRSPLETGRPDGLAYDDDPNDTGGRTCMGLIQREYTAYRGHCGVASRDVWLIEDEEIRDIYYHQYWMACRCDDLPTGVDFAVFDSAVNCSVGMGARFLQRALGVKDDGHIGLGTLAAIKGLTPAAIVLGIIRARETYHHACKTFWKHGDGWLARNRATQRDALAMLMDVPGPEPDYATAAQDSRRATPEAPPASVAETATGQSAVISGATGGGLTLAGVLTLYQQAKESGLLHPHNLMPLAIIAGAVAIIALSRRDWIDRGRKLILGV